MEIYFPMVPKSRSLKSRCLQFISPEHSSEELPSLLPGFWCMLAILNFPWLESVSFNSLPLSLHCLLPCRSISLCLHIAFLKWHQLFDLGPILIQYDLYLQDCTFKFCHIHRCQRLGLEHIFFGGQEFNPQQLV